MSKIVVLSVCCNNFQLCSVFFFFLCSVFSCDSVIVRSMRGGNKHNNHHSRIIFLCHMQNRGEYKRIIRPYVSQFLVEIIVLKNKPKIREVNKALPEPVTRCIFCHLQVATKWCDRWGSKQHKRWQCSTKLSKL